MSRFTVVRVVAGTLAWLMIAALPASAASGLRGRVVDRAGDPVPGAAVAITNHATRETIPVVSDEHGRFESPELWPGLYTLEATLPGIEAKGSATVEVELDRVMTVDLQLAIDMVHESAVVVGSTHVDSVESRAIRESLARDAGESLTRLPGLARVRKGAIANDVVLRSFKGENVSVTIDGARLHGACPGKMDPPAFHIDFAEIERIEVGKGPFDVTTSGAFGGTVNVVTRQPVAGWHGGVQVGLGSFDLVAPSASGSYGGETWSIGGGYSYRRQDPYEDGDGRLFTETTNYRPADWEARAYDVATGWAGLTLAPAPGHRLEFQATAQRVDTALYPYLQMDAVYDDADRYRVAYTGQAPFSGVDLVQASFSWVGVDHWMTDARRVTGDGKPRDYSMATLATASVGEVRASLVFGRVSVGAEAYHRNWSAETTLYVAPARAYRSQDSLPDADTDSAGIFATWEQPLGEAFQLDLGVRLDRAETRAASQRANTDLYEAFHDTRQTSRTDTLPGASATLTWRPHGQWTVFAGLGHSSRVPSGEERYYALQRMGSSWVGNPELEPPRNTEIDLGASYGEARLRAEVSVFRSWVADFVTIYDQPLQNAVPGVATPLAKSYANVDARIWGGELALSVAATPRLTFTLGGSYTHGRQDPDPARNIDSEFLPEMPPLTGRLAVRYDAGSWFAEAIGVFSGAQDDVNTDLNEVPTPGWGILNLRGGLDAGPFSVVLGVDNVFGRLYRESLSYARDPFRSGALVWEPGRSATVSVGLRY